MSVFYAPAMFVLSLLPLWLSILLQEVFSLWNGTANQGIEWFMIVLILIIVCGSYGIVSWQIEKLEQNLSTTTYTLLSAEEDDTFTAEYLVAYVLPLFAFDFTLWQQVILFFIYFIILGYLCIKHKHIYANIVLELKGYSIYRVTLEDAEGTQIGVHMLSNNNLTEQPGSCEIVTIRIDSIYQLDVTPD